MARNATVQCYIGIGSREFWMTWIRVEPNLKFKLRSCSIFENPSGCLCTTKILPIFPMACRLQSFQAHCFIDACSHGILAIALGVRDLSLDGTTSSQVEILETWQWIGIAQWSYYINLLLDFSSNKSYKCNQLKISSIQSSNPKTFQTKILVVMGVGSSTKTKALGTPYLSPFKDWRIMQSWHTNISPYFAISATQRAQCLASAADALLRRCESMLQKMDSAQKVLVKTPTAK